MTSRRSHREVLDLRNKVIKLRSKGLHYRDIAKRLKITFTYVAYLYFGSKECAKERKKRAELRASKYSALRSLPYALELIKSVKVPTPKIIDFICGPCVYVLIGPDQSVLYVGQYKYNMKRVFDFHPVSNAGKIDAEGQVTGARIYKCESAAHMNMLETKLIVDLSPKFNRQLKRNCFINGIAVRERQRSSKN